MVTPEDVVRICQQIEDSGIRLWLTGGWGIDALLGENTRQHKDLDIFVLVDDVVHLNELLAGEGFQLVKLWSENLSTVDACGNKIETGYVLRNPDGQELDVHAFRFDLHGNGIPAWQVDSGFIFSPGDLSGRGAVNGFYVPCQSAVNQMLCHLGYKLPDYQWGDLDRLHEKFGVEFSEELVSQRNGTG